jgi:hypothetical protein
MIVLVYAGRKASMKFLATPLFLAAAQLAFSQASPAPTPNENPEKPNVYMGKLPKVDKSRQRDLKGFVRDDHDNPLDGAIVSLKDLKTGKIVSFRTKQDGAYLFYDLDMDQDYELTTKADGTAAPVVKKFSKYDTRKKPVLNFELAKK